MYIRMYIGMCVFVCVCVCVCVCGHTIHHKAPEGAAAATETEGPPAAHELCKVSLNPKP